MAADLKDTPTAGLNVQLCGDAHLSNFGVFASPERTLVFDLNDFDETLPGPFEYDVKRMAASFTIAARNNGFTQGRRPRRDARVGDGLPRGDGRVRRDATMDIWYAHLSEQDLMGAIDGDRALAEERRKKKRGEGHARRARREDRREGAHPRQPAGAVEARRARRRPVPDRQPAAGRHPAARHGRAPSACPPTRSSTRSTSSSARYRATLQDDRRHLLERFEVVDVARKVVGVGSVGTRAFIVLLQGRDQQDPLFLQVKEATASVLEDHLPKSRYRQPGERVVQGQRMMQAASDIFLGWTKGVQDNRYLYWRQLRDMKGSAVVETWYPRRSTFYAADLRPDPGAGPRPVGRSDRDRGVPRQEGPLRPVDHRLLRALRRPERTGLRGVHPTRSAPAGIEALEGISVDPSRRCPAPCEDLLSVTYDEFISNVVKVVEATGAAILVVGGLGVFVLSRQRGRCPTRQRCLRRPPPRTSAG